jgi:hypothetical protein
MDDMSAASESCGANRAVKITGVVFRLLKHSSKSSTQDATVRESFQDMAVMRIGFGALR